MTSPKEQNKVSETNQVGTEICKFSYEEFIQVGLKKMQ